MTVNTAPESSGNPAEGTLSVLRNRRPRRVAVVSLHTSPLERPGTGDAGGMNVYVAQTATRMAQQGTEVEVFTRATSSDLPPVAELAPGVLVRNIVAGPFEGLDKDELPAQLCAFANGVLREEARHEPGYYDIVHSHYWLSGQVGWLARERWNVPLVHTAHTLAKVKNAALAEGDSAEPRLRVVGEEQVVSDADRLVANTPVEADQLVQMYSADPDSVTTIPPGVDLQTFTPGSAAAARHALNLPADAVVLTFVGRIQPLKAPDVLLYAAAELVRRRPEIRERLVVLIVGGPSGSGFQRPEVLYELAAELEISDVVRFVPPRHGEQLAEVFRASDAVAVPSHNESFGLVALEAQACGAPVVAASVGGLPVAVRDEESGLLVDGHRAEPWARALERVALDPGIRAALSAGAIEQARVFSWDRTTETLLDTYAAAGRAFDAELRGAQHPAASRIPDRECVDTTVRGVTA